MNFTIFHFFRKNEKTPETLDFTGFSGGVFGVPEVIRTPDLPLRRRSLYPAELRKHITTVIISQFCNFVKCLFAKKVDKGKHL